MVGLPVEQGLYDPRNEHDACGIGFVVNIQGVRSHDIITKGLQILVNLAHRGACGCDPETGDGAGILIQIPHRFFARECASLGFALPPEGEYGVGMVFLPVEPSHRLLAEGILERIAREEGLSALGWRDTPVEADAIGRIARASQPYIEQIFIRGASGMSPLICPTRISSTFHRCRRAPLSTRACCWRTRFPSFIPSSPIQTPSARYAWFTSASPPIRFRHGSLRIPIAISATTAKSTPFEATSTGCTRANKCCLQTCSVTISKSFHR
jgi:hypothetical protein